MFHKRPVSLVICFSPALSSWKEADTEEVECWVLAGLGFYQVSMQRKQTTKKLEVSAEEYNWPWIFSWIRRDEEGWRRVKMWWEQQIVSIREAEGLME